MDFSVNEQSCGLLPERAPSLHMFVRKFETVLLTLTQVGSSFGSKTTHLVPSSIDSSIKMNRRRTLIYFQSGSLVIHLAPQTSDTYRSILRTNQRSLIVKISAFMDSYHYSEVYLIPYNLSIKVSKF